MCGAELKSGECYCQLAKARSPKGEGQVLSSPVASNEASALLPVGRPGRGVANERRKKMLFDVMKTSWESEWVMDWQGRARHCAGSHCGDGAAPRWGGRLTLAVLKTCRR